MSEFNVQYNLIHILAFIIAAEVADRYIVPKDQQYRDQMILFIASVSQYLMLIRTLSTVSQRNPEATMIKNHLQNNMLGGIVELGLRHVLLGTILFMVMEKLFPNIDFGPNTNARWIGYSVLVVSMINFSPF